MKRCSLRIFALLLAGAVINAGLAWGVLAHDQYFILKGGPVQVPRFRMDEALTAADKAIWNKDRPAGFLREPTVAFNLTRWGYERMFLSATIGNEIFAIESRDSYRAGWPLRSFEGASWLKTTGKGQPESRVRDRLVTFGPWQNPYREISLPVKIVPLGFVVNTLLFGGILWLLLVVPFKLRRRIIVGGRIKRGRCAACGYSLRDITSEKCPECGCSTPSPALSRKRERAGVRAR